MAISSYPTSSDCAVWQSTRLWIWSSVAPRPVSDRADTPPVRRTQADIASCRQRRGGRTRWHGVIGYKRHRPTRNDRTGYCA